jgi:hypothetical protein
MPCDKKLPPGVIRPDANVNFALGLARPHLARSRLDTLPSMHSGASAVIPAMPEISNYMFCRAGVIDHLLGSRGRT